MNTMNQSRRSFLKVGSLLTIGVILTPAMSVFSNHSDNTGQQKVWPIRSDVRSLDFDSHNFLLNFRR